MKKKLQSDSGASIVFALLIFLLCGVVASVILAAATAASGRLAGVTEMDQRYYAVTSAAELFREALNEEGIVTVVRTKTTETGTKTTYTNTEDGAVLTGQPAVSVTTDLAAALNGADLSGDPEVTLLQELALFMVFGADGYIGETILDNAWQREVFDPAAERSFALELKLESEALDADTLAALEVNVSGVLKADGTLELLFSNANGADTYSVVMILAADVDQSSFEETRENPPVIRRNEETNSFTETMTVTVTETKTAAIRWVMTDMKKVVSSHEAS